MNVKGKKSVDSFHKRLGKIMWDYVGMARNKEGLKKQLPKSKHYVKNFGLTCVFPVHQ
jgi:succinate dehydrogenase / fumarate reductase flavoprotein subunit